MTEDAAVLNNLKDERDDERNKEGNDLRADTGKELEICRKERDEYLEGWKRARADLLNYKKEEEERAQNIVRFSNELLISELISVLDNLNRAIAGFTEGAGAKLGVEMVKNQMEDILKHYGLEIINIKPGDTVNGIAAEVVEAVESDLDSGIVIEELEKGYKLYGKVIKPAKVKAAK